MVRFIRLDLWRRTYCLYNFALHWWFPTHFTYVISLPVTNVWSTKKVVPRVTRLYETLSSEPSPPPPTSWSSNQLLLYPATKRDVRSRGQPSRTGVHSQLSGDKFFASGKVLLCVRQAKFSLCLARWLFAWRLSYKNKTQTVLVTINNGHMGKLVICMRILDYRRNVTLTTWTRCRMACGTCLCSPAAKTAKTTKSSSCEPSTKCTTISKTSAVS